MVARSNQKIPRDASQIVNGPKNKKIDSLPKENLQDHEEHKWKMTFCHVWDVLKFNQVKLKIYYLIGHGACIESLLKWL